MASIYLTSASLYRNIGYLYFFEDLGKRKLSFRKLILNLYLPLTILVFDSQKHCSGLCGTRAENEACLLLPCPSGPSLSRRSSINTRAWRRVVPLAPLPPRPVTGCTTTLSILVGLGTFKREARAHEIF